MDASRSENVVSFESSLKFTLVGFKRDDDDDDDDDDDTEVQVLLPPCRCALNKRRADEDVKDVDNNDEDDEMNL